jgi:hypothetical protein
LAPIESERGREGEREREKDLASLTDLHCSELEIFLGFK